MTNAERIAKLEILLDAAIEQLEYQHEDETGQWESSDMANSALAVDSLVTALDTLKGRPSIPHPAAPRRRELQLDED
jgi:hypothetical protein